MRRNPLYLFQDTESIGIYEVPLKSTVHLVDRGNGFPMFLQLVKKDNLDQFSTIQDLLDNPDHYVDITTSGSSLSQLEKIIEDGKQGWRMYGREADFYGNIGTGAIDFSENVSTEINTGGATGDSSFALGIDTIAGGSVSIASGNRTEANGVNSFASGNLTVANGVNSASFGNGTVAKCDNSIAFGKWNETTGALKNGLLLSVGGGTDILTRSNLFEIFEDGRIIAPKLTRDKIIDMNSLVTKEYIDNSSSVSQLQRVTETGETGWRILGRDINNFGDIGEGAIDLSSQTLPGSNGATGSYSLTAGINTIASGENSFAVGYNNIASGDSATALGESTVASGESSFTTGSETKAIGPHSNAAGFNTTATGAGSHTEGYLTTALGENGHAEGSETNADGENSHVEGSGSRAVGANSHAGGFESGSVGEGSFAHGIGAASILTGSAAFGSYNIQNINNIFSVGIGNSFMTPQNAFEIDKDGRVFASSLTTAMIDTTVDDSILITKEYLNGSVISELERVTCDGSPDCSGSIIPGSNAYRLRYRYNTEPDNYLKPGSEAIDFSFSSTTVNGGCGASGSYSFAEGYDTISAGTCSHASGLGTIAKNINQFVLGRYNKDEDGSILIVGNGVDNDHRSNALVIYEDGRIESPGLDFNIDFTVVAEEQSVFVVDNGTTAINTIREVLLNGVKLKEVIDYTVAYNGNTATIGLNIPAQKDDWIQIGY